MSNSSNTLSNGTQAEVSEAVLSHLISSHKVDDLHSSLVNSLAAVGWTDRVRKLAFELLRSEKHNHFEDVVDRIVSLATTTGDGDGILSGKRKRDGEQSDNKLPNGNGKLKRPRNGALNDKGSGVSKDAVKQENGGPNGTHDDTSTDGDLESGVRIPAEVVNDGVRFLQDAMHDIFTSDDEKNTDDGDDDAEFDEEEYVEEQNDLAETTNGSFAEV